MELVSIKGTRNVYRQAKQFATRADKTNNAELAKSLGLSTSEDEEVATFTCGPTCGCHRTKKAIANSGDMFPRTVVYERVGQFLAQLRLDGIEPTVPEHTQLIFTSVNNTSSTKFDVSRIIRMCTKLIQPGGHIFLRMSPEKFDIYKKEFEGHSQSSMESSFTIDPTPYYIIARPEDEQKKRGKSGPVSIDVTVQMLHLMRNTGAPRAEALENTDIENQGHTRSKYRACTNVMDDGLERENGKYGISIRGTREIIERYTKGGDIVVDFWANESHTAAACISLPEARICIGGMEDKAKKKKLEGELADRIIYHAGKGSIAEGMGYDDALIDEMKDIYETHLYERRFHKNFGLDPVIAPFMGVEKFPILSSIPLYLLQCIAISASDTSILTRMDDTTSPNKVISGVGRIIAQSDGEEMMRAELLRLTLNIIPIDTQMTMGLISMIAREDNFMIGNIYGVVIKGGWEENHEALESLGNSIFEYDEDTVETKRIPLKSFLVEEEGEETADMYLVPAKYCAFRYAEFVQGGGNAKIRSRNSTKIRIGKIHLYFNLEIVLTQVIEKDESIIIKIE